MRDFAFILRGTVFTVNGLPSADCRRQPACGNRFGGTGAGNPRSKEGTYLFLKLIPTAYPSFFA
jgi:hypothetical protein